MLNRVVLAGRLVRDPELKYTPNGVAVANFTLAVNRPFKSQSGESEADFINCVVWRKPAENLANYMSKGSLVGVDGRVQTRSFDNQEGKKVYVTEIVADSVQFLESKGGSNTQSNNQSYNGGGQANQQQNNDPFKDKGEPIDISDDDLPF
ncbi:single-stranded DNA-binding protein [Virgibacillus sp. 7505]|uniref:single-stranded DNA-binding protein n=1 Tax=Virgibacillus sp. 7505 TaxID=2022548 RepID=UPI000BA628D6|nr:single-stranded DNA-binding protein [Virgibacillus sp. 7505]PAE17263.1 single-stranded DNA-binding protein [Virgibacillus sp. 7505]